MMISKKSKDHFDRGFTLIELVVVVAIVAIFAAIALPSYQQYVRRSIAAQAQQEMYKLAEQLERHKSRNFSYKGFNANYLYNTTGTVPFNASNQTLNLPLATDSLIKYRIEIKDGVSSNPLLIASTASGQRWAIKAIADNVNNTNNYSFLLTSTGIKCKSKTPANISYTSCGTSGSEEW